mmetsp:Transcript_23624/g.81769  ORF Transcript_23624/g.81769 Transcript_23624/m.81769 type:complete len:224 (+) Transcript_23624:423-1094(+)
MAAESVSGTFATSPPVLSSALGTRPATRLFRRGRDVEMTWTTPLHSETASWTASGTASGTVAGPTLAHLRARFWDRRRTVSGPPLGRLRGHLWDRRLDRRRPQRDRRRRRLRGRLWKGLRDGRHTASGTVERHRLRGRRRRLWDRLRVRRASPVPFPVWEPLLDRRGIQNWASGPKLGTDTPDPEPAPVDAKRAGWLRRCVSSTGFGILSTGGPRRGAASGTV